MTSKRGSRGQIAVLGAGIMGSLTALSLARLGYGVTLFDEAPAPMSGASRWNEGKIHLGFLYAADRSLRTARGLIDGGLAFQPLLESLLGASIAGFATEDDDLYLVHANSIVSTEAMADYVEQVGELVVPDPRAASYFGGMKRPCRLAASELAAMSVSQEVVAGFATPERSVDTQVVADLIVSALRGDGAVEIVTDARVTDLTCVKSEGRERWRVKCSATEVAGFDGVVNALWHGLPQIDNSVGIAGDRDFSHRYRVSVFVETSRTVAAPCAVLCTGPFGDIKSYPGGRYYLSWYEHGLMASASALTPPEQPILNGASKTEIATRIIDRLSAVLPVVSDIREAALTTAVEGGWVLALGDGTLNDPQATIHRRDRFGIVRSGSYVSVNTGKYSMAPLLAQKVAAAFA